ncbi:hypothetical protein I602_880 [Polaribacter dokdonensis DSW-5]|uniref:Uncharacterized protein n=1 Tax=Polaribacter dokdonensis DSW-5 TaxID=1300348 RepID=A0A0N0CF52_9FLAO|nr:hypothetical protein I602_880 [Polaribacter dokdonensis DSW-5]
MQKKQKELKQMLQSGLIIFRIVLFLDHFKVKQIIVNS